MKTIKEVITLSAEYIEKAGFPSARVDAEWLIGHALKMKRMELYLQFDRPLSEDELGVIRPLISRRAKGEPVQYICGSTEFYGYEFKVGPGVLVPRPETELLVDAALNQCRDGMAVLDLCTGSGAIAVSLKKEKPSLKVTAIDICPQALEYAKANAETNEVEIEFLEGDLFQPIEGRVFDLITVNPPYVKETERPLMGKDVLAHEPSLALFAGDDGMDILKVLAQNGRDYLSEKGVFISEIGFAQGREVQDLFLQNGWSGVKVLQDLNGKDRFIFCFK